MARRKTEKPYVQFSKRLVTAIMLFWGAIRAASVVAVFVTPESGEHMAAIVRGVDDIAMVIVLAYTGNSISEKIALGYFDMRAREAQGEKDETDEKEEEAENG